MAWSDSYGRRSSAGLPIPSPPVIYLLDRHKLRDAIEVYHLETGASEAQAEIVLRDERMLTRAREWAQRVDAEYRAAREQEETAPWRYAFPAALALMGTVLLLFVLREYSPSASPYWPPADTRLRYALLLALGVGLASALSFALAGVFAARANCRRERIASLTGLACVGVIALVLGIFSFAFVGCDHPCNLVSPEDELSPAFVLFSSCAGVGTAVSKRRRKAS